MADLEVPGSANLFVAVGDDVNPNRPLLTGDVITGVSVPVLTPDELTVIVLAHPCAMRVRGIDLAERLLVAPVIEHTESGDQVWRRHFKVFPLDGLPGYERPAVALNDATLCHSTDLSINRRLSCASRAGINLLRQRFVHHLTRVVVPTWHFDTEAAATFEEVDLLEAWIDQAEAADVDDQEATAAFHEWVRGSDDGRSRQEQLGNPQWAPSIRRAATVEMRERYRS